MNRLIKDFAFYFINHILNRIPSRRFRMICYSILSKGKINKLANIGLNVRILDIRNIYISEGSNINYGCLLDGRGATLKIGSNSDIAPLTLLWTLEHHPNDPDYSARGGDIVIGNNVWIGSNTTILPNSTIKDFTIIGAASVFKGESTLRGIYFGKKATLQGERNIDKKYSIQPIRRFR